MLLAQEIWFRFMSRSNLAQVSPTTCYRFSGFLKPVILLTVVIHTYDFLRQLRRWQQKPKTPTHYAPAVAANNAITYLYFVCYLKIAIFLHYGTGIKNLV